MIKKKQILVVLLLALIGYGTWLLRFSNGPRQNADAESPSAMPGRTVGRGPERGARTKTPRVDSIVVPDGVFERIVTTGSRAEIPLPGGRYAELLVESQETDAAGEWIMAEGRLLEPVEGRFIFRRQPEGTPSGRYAGAIRFPDEGYGYILKESVSGRPMLVLEDADDVSCVHYPMPTAPIPQVDADAAAADPDFLLPTEHPTDVPIPDYQNGVIPLQSLPGATGVIYLDFDGEAGPHGGWGDFDAAPSGATNPQVIQVWSRVAEDYAPFNLNVTTDLQVYLDAPETSRQRCIITPTTTAAPGAGGVAYVGSWNWAGDTPCWAFYSTGKAAAEVISHEVGHTLGLSHDGQNPDIGYYGGHGSGDTGWAPIMGVGYYQNLTQWSRGEYAGANQTQDDLAIMDGFNSVDLRADDHGDSAASASPLEIYGTTVDDDGVIGTRSDVDVFSFTTTGGTLTLHIAPVSAGPDLDISAEIRNASNAVVASSNPDLKLDATFTNISLAAGSYTIRVDGVGRGSVSGDGYSDYASLGHYAIDGTISGALSPDRFAVNEYPPIGTPVGTVTPKHNHGANPLTFGIVSGNDGGAFAIAAATGALTVANPSQFNHDLLSKGWNDPAELELYVSVTDVTQPALNETLRVVVTVNDTAASPPVILAHRYSFATDASDSAGNADLTLVGGAAILSGQLDLPGGATRTNHAKAQGAALAELASTFHGSSAVTIEAWFNQDTARDWAKIFMAGVSAGDDYLDITPRRLVDGNVSSMSIRNNTDIESHVIGGGPLANNVSYYFAATWDGATNRMTLRMGPSGGTLQTHTASMNGRTPADIGITEFYLGSAVYWGDPDFDGQIDEFRIWSGALSDTKVASDFAAGPNPPGDSDLDGLPDSWELSFTGISNLAALDGNMNNGVGPGAGSGDYDGDDLSDAEEYAGGIQSTDPTKSDTDGDDYPDKLERLLGTDPTDPQDKPAATLAHRYSFNSDTSDAVGAADLVLVGNATVSGGQLDLPGGSTRSHHAMASGAALATLAGTIRNSYALTIEAWFNQDVAQDWAKLLMVGKGSDYNYMDITLRRATEGNISSQSIRTAATEKFLAGSPGGGPLVNNVKYYLAAVWNPLTDMLILRMGPVGGSLSSYSTTMDGQRLADLVINEFRIGAAVQWPDPDFDGQIDELRIWRGALSGAEAAASFAAGPGQPAGDLDEDGLPDEWEFSFTGVKRLSDLSPDDDFDHDGLDTLAEYHAGTNPTNPDSDGDGFTDGFEVAHGSDPDNGGIVPVIPPTVLAHRYSFTTDGTDSVGNADLSLVGGATVASGALELPGGTSRTNHASAQGAALAALNETVAGAFALSMECWFRQDTAQNWSKVFMAGKGSGGEYLDITPRRGTSGNVSSISFNDGSSESTAIGGPNGAPVASGTTYYCAAVWDPATDRLRMSIGPVGGALSTFSASLGGRLLGGVSLAEFYLGAAVQFPDRDFDGTIDEFRVWNGALDAAMIAEHFAIGPDQIAAVATITGAAMNPARDTFTLDVSGLVGGQVYHIEDAVDPSAFGPLSGSEFVAPAETSLIDIPVDPAAVPRRFFRVARGAAGAP